MNEIEKLKIKLEKRDLIIASLLHCLNSILKIYKNKGSTEYDHYLKTIEDGMKEEE